MGRWGVFYGEIFRTGEWQEFQPLWLAPVSSDKKHKISRPFSFNWGIPRVTHTPARSACGKENRLLSWCACPIAFNESHSPAISLERAFQISRLKVALSEFLPCSLVIRVACKHSLEVFHGLFQIFQRDRRQTDRTTVNRTTLPQR